MIKIADSFLKRMRRGRDFSSKDNPPEELMKVLKDGFLDGLKTKMGWESDAKMARALDFSPGFISQIRNHKKPVTHELESRLVWIIRFYRLSSLENFYDWKVIGKYDQNHQKWNWKKNTGQIPYDEDSLVFEERLQDSPNVSKRSGGFFDRENYFSRLKNSKMKKKLRKIVDKW